MIQFWAGLAKSIMRILTRYILREVTSHALIGIAVFTFVLFTRDLGRILELVVRNSAPLPSVAELFFFTVPVALIYTIPMGVLVGILIGLSRLAADSEITAMRASGTGCGRVCGSFPSLRRGRGFWRWSTESTWPPNPKPRSGGCRNGSRARRYRLRFSRGCSTKDSAARALRAGFHSARGAAIWKGVFIADISTSTPRITLAQQGILVSEGPDKLHLHLTNGSTHEVEPGDPGFYRISTFQQWDIPISFPQAGSKQEEEPAPLRN